MPGRLSVPKRTVLTIIVSGHRKGVEYFTKPMLVKYPGTSGAGGVGRTLTALTEDGYLSKDGDDGQARYRATPAGAARLKAVRGRKRVLTADEIALARGLLAERSRTGKKVRTQADVAKQLRISVSALRVALHPEYRETQQQWYAARKTRKEEKK